MSIRRIEETVLKNVSKPGAANGSLGITTDFARFSTKIAHRVSIQVAAVFGARVEKETARVS